MLYPNISMSSVLNYIYFKSTLNRLFFKNDCFQIARNTADMLYNFAWARKYIHDEPYMPFVLSVLKALTGDGSVSSGCQSAVNHYFEASKVCKYNSAPSDYIAAIRDRTEQLAAEYNTALEKTAETRRILSHLSPLFFNADNNLVVDYIKYVRSYEPEYPDSILYSSLYNIGFMQGIRAERARRNGTPIEQNARVSAALYRGRKHKRRYPHTAS